LKKTINFNGLNSKRVKLEQRKN